jgi:hypothetical protein
MERISKDLTAALVDNEIHDGALKNQLIQQMKDDVDLNYDFMVQSLVKNLIRDKVHFQTTPNNIRHLILSKIQPKEFKVSNKLSSFIAFFSRPALSFVTLIIIVIAVILIIMNRPGPVDFKDFAIEQLGQDNMFVQATNNFRSIVEGKLEPQLVSSNPDEIKNFFWSSGVKYSTIVPEMTRWDLLGAVVSEDKGEKFAHHVYANKEGELVYLFQVDQSYLKSHEIIQLTDDLLSYIDEGNCYTTLKDSYSTLMAKSELNIYAVVSNASLEDISQYFCGLN